MMKMNEIGECVIKNEIGRDVCIQIKRVKSEEMCVFKSRE